MALRRRVYLRAVIENFSRRIFARNAIGTFDPEFAAKLLLDAVRCLSCSEPVAICNPAFQSVDGTSTEDTHPSLKQ